MISKVSTKERKYAKCAPQRRFSDAEEINMQLLISTQKAVSKRFTHKHPNTAFFTEKSELFRLTAFSM